MNKLTSAGEESISALRQLRAANQKVAERKPLLDQIENQLGRLQALRQEKDVLTAQLQALLSGENPFVSEADPALDNATASLRDLKEKLAVHRVIGPCGLTVLDVGPDTMVVTFTSMWRKVTEVFLLSIVAIGQGQFKVKGTTIPYFLGAQSLVEQTESPEWGELMDQLGHRLNAYVRRKGEMEAVKTKHKEVLKNCSSNDAVTAIQLHLCDSTGKDIECWLDYSSVDALLPRLVEVDPEALPCADRLIQAFSELPLTEALPKVTTALGVHNTQDLSIHDTSAGE